MFDINLPNESLQPAGMPCVDLFLTKQEQIPRAKNQRRQHFTQTYKEVISLTNLQYTRL